MAGNITKDEQEILFLYVVKNISTTRLQDDYNYDMSTIESVFIKYNINYPDRNNDSSRRGFRRGFHLGKYKNGYINNLNRKCIVDKNVIYNYMVSYQNRMCGNLEDYLSAIFDEEPQPRSQPQPRSHPQPYYEPQQQNGSNTADNLSSPNIGYSNTSSYNSGGSIKGILVLIAIVGIIFLVCKTMVAPFFFGIGNSGEMTDKTAYYLSPDADASALTVDIAFSGNSSQLLFKSGYVFCIDELESSMEIGYVNSFSGDFEQGEHKIWVKSGKKKSKVYTVDLIDDASHIEFDCSIGVFGPKLKLTNIEGAEKK